MSVTTIAASILVGVFLAGSAVPQDPAYVLTAAAGGIKLQAPVEGSCVAAGPNGPSAPPPPPGSGAAPVATCGRITMSFSPAGGRLVGGQVPMSELTRVLSRLLGRNVIDRTAFTRTFDIQLAFMPDQTIVVPLPPPAAGAVGGPSLFAALQQLGLKLE